MPVRRGSKKAPKTLSSKTIASKAMGLGVAALAASPAANAATFTVTNLADSGAGSLRQAVSDANVTPGADLITFQSGLTGTITLTTGQLPIAESVNVDGPGPAVLTVSGNNASRIFYLYVVGQGDLDVRIAGLTLTEGAANIGAAIVNFDADLLLEDMLITGNTAAVDGGGLWSNTFAHGVTIRDSSISGNVAGDDGGGIYFYDTGTEPLLIENSVISGNQALSDGGGVYFYHAREVTIRETEISNNSAAFGGGVFLYSTGGEDTEFRIERSTISGNEALIGGGFFFYSSYEPVVFENSTISGNGADMTDGGGGGIFFYALYSGLALNFTTVTLNSAAAGAGVLTIDGVATVDNSIVSQNTGTVPTQNDLGSVAGSFDVSFSNIGENGLQINDLGGNQFGVDPQLGPLADNGGPTETHRPALTSPVIDAADPAAVPPPSTDQRGQPRAYPTRADMGAVEIVGGAIEFKPITYTVAENGGSVTLTLVRDSAADPASVLVTLNAGTATGGGVDYTGSGGTVTFAPGELSQTFVVPIVDDALVEGDEQFTAVLSTPSAGASLGTSTAATVTITDFEAGQFALSSPTYSVGEQGGFVTITVNRINGASGAASVNYSTAPGTATPGAGNDYTGVAGTLNWADGDTAPKTFDVPILDDAIAEGNENFSVALATPSAGTTIGSPATATVTIVDDPAGTAHFNVASVDTTEEAGSVVVTVTRTGGTEGPLTVNYSTADGTATTPSDYTPAVGTITFPAGSAAPQTFTITLIDDDVNEGPEMFTANLSGAGAGAPSSITINLAASDAAPGIPTLSWYGRVFLTLMSAVAGLYVIVRNRFSMVLLGMLLIGMMASPSAMAESRRGAGNGGNGGKFAGTVQSAQNLDGNLVLTLAGGISITIPLNVPTTVTDNRTAKPKTAQLTDITKGTHVIVRLRTDAQGTVKNVKIKIKS